MRVSDRSFKPPSNEVASSNVSTKGVEPPTLFTTIAHLSDSEDDADDDGNSDEIDKGDVGNAGNTSEPVADAQRKHGCRLTARRGKRRSTRHTQSGRAVDKLRLLAVGVAYILRDYETAYATIRDVCELRPSSARPNHTAINAFM